MSTTPHLHLQRLQVAQLRKFQQLELADLAPGLNIIAGPNGAGKSSLARAIRASFLDRSNSNSAADLQPVGDSSAAPAVELSFQLHGQPYQLHKSFLKRKRCDLQIGSRSLSGAEAEDHLGALLGFSFAPKGSKAEYWGVPGLLWVEQGQAPEAIATQVAHAAQHLGSALHAQAPQALSSSAAQLAATAGDALIAQLEGELSQWLGKSRQPIGAYAQLLAELASAQQTWVHQQQRIAEYRQQVDELAQLQAQAQEQQRLQPEVTWQQELAAARAQLQQLQALQQQHDQAAQQLPPLEQRLRLLAQALQQHDSLQQQLAQRAAAVAQAEAAVAQAEPLAAQARAQVQHSLAQRDAALTAWEQAQHARQRQDAALRCQQAQAQAERLAASVQQAQALQQQVATQAQALQGQTLTQQDVQQLRKLDDAVFKATLQRDALATQLQFTLPEGQVLDWQAASQHGQWQGQGTVALDQPTTVQLPGGGQLRITPGGQDVARAGAQLAQACTALQAALQRCDVASYSDAQARWERIQQDQHALEMAQQLLHAQAPQGIEALQLELRQQQAQVAALQQQLQALPALVDGVEAGDWQATQHAWQAAQTAVETAQRQQQASLAQQAMASQRLQAARTEHQALAAQLQDPAIAARHRQLQEEAALLQAERSQLQQRIADQAQALDPSRAHFAAQDIERLERTLHSHAAQALQRKDRITHLQATLAALGADGLEEASAQQEATIAQLQQRADALARRTQALALLVDRLKAKRSAALRRLQAPLEARMRHYLQLLLPGGTLELDEHLVPQRVLASGPLDAAGQRVAGHFAQLSHGTQEQIAIVSRLAYADLLRDAGQPTLLMLDDALVHSDAARLAQMKRVLFDAAQRHQVLLFTCRPQDWQDAGVAIRHLPG